MTLKGMQADYDNMVEQVRDSPLFQPSSEDPSSDAD
jgi:hypothetical protein